MSGAPPHVGLFVTCLVDLFRPSVGFATVRLLERAGCRVSVPAEQTCCGQPAFSQGAREEARALARQVIETFSGFDYVVLPSGSCAATLRRHYPELLADDPAWANRARALSERTHELTSFLADVIQFTEINTVYDGKVAYHDSCSGLRELGIREQPRRLLGLIDGLHETPLANPEGCCGFGGAFCVKYPGISDRLATDKSRQVVESGADLLLGGDLGCLLNLAGTLRRQGATTEVRHVAEVLADQTEAPPIGRE
ncbi:MAG: (Fe-S)-binding protein [Gammaproteobacteria bacterium]|jgi:L-lactate dehydrogenase complex protein LldE|nr:(Fe-S)-binding protein [Gammaproteobacteria bacterium]